MAHITLKKKMRLSKSKYLTGLQCSKALWINIHKRDVIPPISPGTQSIFDMGHEVGELAQTRFSGGTLISEAHYEIPQAEKSTHKAIVAGASAIYEATFTHKDVSVRLDILVHVEGKGDDAIWDMVEVKSGTRVKDVNVCDMSIQRWVLEGAGLKIRKCFLMHLNRRYVRKGALDVNELFTLSEVTDRVADIIHEVPVRVKEMREVLAQEEMPEIRLGAHCNKPNDCLLLAYCQKGLPEFSIYNLPRLSWEKIASLQDQKITKAADIPADFPLNGTQQLHVDVAKSGKGVMDGKFIQEYLGKLQYPLYYLDFETCMSGLPSFDGLSPYDTLTFQASLHVQKKPGGKLEHFEFLGDAKSDPQAKVIDFLLKNIGPTGSIVAYNAPYEIRCIEDLAKRFPKKAQKLRSLKDRFWDLIVPFKQRKFVHPKQNGSASLKSVLPAFDPKMSYSDMKIGCGDDASIAYQQMMTGKLSEDQFQDARKNLLEYCKQDTLGMVVILDRLKSLKSS